MSSSATQDQELRDASQALRLRQEPGGHFVAFQRDEGAYLFVNRRGALLIEELADGDSVQECGARLEQETGTPRQGIDARLKGFASELAGSPAPGPPAAEDGLPYAWSLQADLGRSAGRCETFGMPL